MVNGMVVGIILDNVDPNGMHRVKVQYPVESGEGLESSWCRMTSPMAGANRGLVILPDAGTEVLLAFAYRSMSPYVIGAVYNGVDVPGPYANGDGDNNRRVFWSRNDHMVVFDDTAGAEMVNIGAQASGAEDVTSAPIYQTLDSANKTITMFCEKNTEVEAVETISIKCKDLKIDATNGVTLTSGAGTATKSGSSTEIKSSGTQKYEASTVQINPAAPPPDPQKAMALPAHSHPPTS
ncbi:MAG: phage baseplate assembly protein V [Myxococcota bacterium]